MSAAVMPVSAKSVKSERSSGFLSFGFETFTTALSTRISRSSLRTSSSVIFSLSGSSENRHHFSFRFGSRKGRHHEYVVRVNAARAIVQLFQQFSSVVVQITGVFLVQILLQNKDNVSDGQTSNPRFRQPFRTRLSTFGLLLVCTGLVRTQLVEKIEYELRN